MVTQVHTGSIAALAGIRPGVLIQEVNRKRVSNTEDFKRAVEQTPEHEAVLMLIKDEEYSRYVVLEMEENRVSSPSSVRDTSLQSLSRLLFPMKQ